MQRRNIRGGVMYFGWGCGAGGCRRLIGLILLGAGALMVICCTPFWLWCSFIGVGLIIIGCFLLKSCYH